MSRTSLDERLTRLLTMVPWVSQEDGPTVEEVCERYGYKESDLAADLELLFVCGLYPFTPDALIEADIVDGRVWIRYADMLAPVRLNPTEALTLLSAATAVLAMPADSDREALSRARTKLATALGIDHEEVVEIELNSGSPEVLAAVRQATDTRRAIDVDYYSYGRDSWGRRTLAPYRVFSSGGQWYLWALKLDTSDLRLFRIDRMRNVAILDDTFDPPSQLPPARVYQARPDDPVVVLDLAPRASWVAEQYPIEERQQRPDGSLRVSLRVSEQAWIERLLLRLGTDATVVEGKIDVSSSVERILNRYEKTTASTASADDDGRKPPQ